MPVQIDVWSDFVCPWCFLASVTLERLQQSHNIEINRHAFELRPQGSPPMPQDYRDYIEQVGHPQFVAAARARYGLEINAGPFGIDSRKALIGAQYARLQGASDAYHDAVYRAYWQQAQSIDDPEVLVKIAASVDLDAGEFREALASSELDMAVSLDIAQARRYEITSVPSMIFDKQYLVSGAQPYEVLSEIVDKIQLGEALA